MVAATKRQGTRGRFSCPQHTYTTGFLSSATVSRDYTYGDSAWGDLLTNWHGYDLTYDEIGNVLSDRDSVFTWEHGRELTSMTAVGFLWQFTYDQNGMRTSRTNGTRVYNYVYNGSSLSQVTVDNHDLNFTYDTSGSPLSLIYDGTAYWYDLNLQGDVVGILDSNGNTVVRYTYNAWGCILSITGSEKDTVGFYNPLRYRGYVWDPETGLYYVSSRYYSPGLGRWINADSVIAGTGENILGYNMFAYCFNNPVNMSDPAGNWPSWSTILKAAAIAVTAVAVVAAVAVTVATFGATSIAATIVVSSAITIAAKTTEVAVLQGKRVRVKAKILVK